MLKSNVSNVSGILCPIENIKLITIYIICIGGFMNYFSNLNPIIILILLVLGYLSFSVIVSSNQIESYEHFNNFFCSGWAGECTIK